MTDKKQKILYVITKGNFGGAQRYVFDLATSLPHDRFDVAVALGEGDVLPEKLHTACIRTIRIDSIGRDMNVSGDFKVLRELVRLFRTEKPDVIHLNSSKIGGLGGLAGRIARVPHIIFTGHAWAFNEERSAFSKFVIGILHWITIILSHCTIAVSKKTTEQISILPFVRSKIKTIYNGIPTYDFLSKDQARAALIEKNPTLVTHKNAFWIGTTSELHKNKGLDYMVESMADITKTHPDTYFIVMGEGEERKKLEKKIAELCPHNIFLLGFVLDARQYIKAFDIFTLTSRTEAFPYAILEAGQAGLPIVASPVGGIPEVITDMSSGVLVRPYRPADMARSIMYLIEHPDKRVLYGNTLKEKVATEFTLKNMVDNTVSLYRNNARIQA